MSLASAQYLLPFVPPALSPLLKDLVLPGGPDPRNPSQGPHPSPRRGQSVEFFEHRGYVQGDEVRHIDWRASAKGQRTLVRFGEQERRLPLYIILDSHAGMAYGLQNPPERWSWARGIAALLAYCALRDGDPVTLITSTVSRPRPSLRRDDIAGMAKGLSITPQSDASHLGPTLSAVAAQRPAPSRFFCISDWLDVSTPEQSHHQAQTALFEQIHMLSHQGHRLWGLELLHHDELEFSFKESDNSLCFVDPKGRRPSLIGDPETLREPYLLALQNHRSALAKLANDARLRWCPMRSDVPWSTQLRDHLMGSPKGQPHV